MGKRPTNKTKSGKFMNPTDQARKEARKKELKKNKRQRQLVRTAVLKGKNPRDIVSELEKIDDMEFDVAAPPTLNEKVLREKRAKLVGTWNRVIRLYEKEDPEQYLELKRLWHAYNARKNAVAAHYDSVKNAQNVSLDEIPLPANDKARTDEIPLPPKVSILKKPSSVLDILKPKSCPGVPSVPPPSLGDYDITEDEQDAPRKRKIRFNDDESEEVDNLFAPGEESTPRVGEVQRKMLAMAGQDVDAYMQEMEEVHRQTQAEKAADLHSRLSRLEDQQPRPPGVPDTESGPPPLRPPISRMPLGHPPRPPLFIRPSAPPLRPGVPPPGVRLPPGPPPGRPPVPPGPPPGRPPMSQQQRPPRMMASGMPLPRPPSNRLQGPKPQSVLSAGPQLNINSSGTGGVIEAKPLMRNLRSDVTRFIPTNLRIKRDDSKNPYKKQQDPMTKDVFAKHSKPQAPQKSKDDAYAQFMTEMDELMK